MEIDVGNLTTVFVLLKTATKRFRWIVREVRVVVMSPEKEVSCRRGTLAWLRPLVQPVQSSPRYGITPQFGHNAGEQFGVAFLVQVVAVVIEAPMQSKMAV